MTPAPVRLSPAAARDVRAIARRYRADAGEALALDFADALAAALRHIAEHPASGSPRMAHDLDLPGLRAWPLHRFPHIVFHRERPAIIDVGASCTAAATSPRSCASRRG